MKKLKETFLTLIDAFKRSIEFSMRYARKDTKWQISMTVVEKALSYGLLFVSGLLVSSIQTHLMGPTPTSFTIYDFINGPYFWFIIGIVACSYIMLSVGKFQRAFSSRRNQILKNANNVEYYGFIAKLDVGRKRSKQYDDLNRKINELPQGHYTRMGFAEGMFELVGMISGMLVFGIPLFFGHPFYTGILVLTVLPTLAAEVSGINRRWKLQQELIPFFKKRSVLEQAFHGTAAFLQGKMFGQHPTLLRLIRENQDEVQSKVDDLRWSNVRLTIATHIATTIGLICVYCHAVLMTLSHGGDLGALTVLLASAKVLQGSLIGIISTMANQSISAEGVIMIEKDFFGMKPYLTTSDPVVPSYRGVPEIRFENVSFNYPEKDKLIMKNISLTIPGGKKVAIIGKNGSAKSTFANLLIRAYDPTQGNIFLGDINYRNMDPGVVGRHVTALLQQYQVIDRTVGEEIASSRLDEPVDLERVAAAARKADFMKVVEEDPKGFNSQIGTEFGGREFSGGEEQKLVIARALLPDTPVKIFDEPDSALDAEAAQIVIDNLLALSGTVILITQYPSRAEKCDIVIVLKEGELAEMGSPAELAVSGGVFARLLNADRQRNAIQD